jgi:hypothetical protein
MAIESGTLVKITCPNDCCPSNNMRQNKELLKTVKVEFFIESCFIVLELVENIIGIERYSL